MMRDKPEAPPPPPLTTVPRAVDATASAADGDICTVDDVAVWLGVDRKTIYAAAQRREIPCGRLGRRIVMSRAQITAWLAGRFP